jgi:hypothetical protein
LAYIIPSNSFYANQSTDEVLENIESDIVNRYSGKGNIILCGDLNARTGSESDCIQDDSNDEHLPLYENYNSVIIQEKRCSHDCKVDNRGKKLLDLCIGSKLRFLNGRMWGNSYGKFTCIKPSGSSVVDYVIMSEKLLENTLYFKFQILSPLIKIVTVGYHLDCWQVTLLTPHKMIILIYQYFLADIFGLHRLDKNYVTH